MNSLATRRKFLKSAFSGGLILGLGELPFLSRLRPVTAEEARLDPKMVRFDPAIEPAVRLLEETPRERLLEEVAMRIRRGLSYRELLSALLLAGVRNIQPRPQVGFKFHAVLVVNSAHLASLSSPDSDRWLPILWALDYFKDSQARDVSEGNWTMGPVDESKVPSTHEARRAFTAAMDNWDEAAADAAVAGLARGTGVQEIFELFWRYGARDFRAIGHKAIFVANSWRTLSCIGWQHAEPVLRSLAYALLNHEGENPAKRDAEADRPWRRHLELAGKIRENWRDGKPSAEATAELLAALRQGSDEEAAKVTVDLLNRGVAPQSVWDGLFSASGELLLRQPGIVALHAVTTTNALRFAYEMSGVEETRKLMLLQNAAFVALFRATAEKRGQLGGQRIDSLEPAEAKPSGQPALEEIFAEVSKDRLAAARRALAYLKSGGSCKDLIEAARRLVFLKGNDPHDYKFSSAVFEDYQRLSSPWREAFLASSMMSLNGAGEPDNELVKRARAAFSA